MTQKATGFFTHKSDACSEKTQMLGSARTVREPACDLFMHLGHASGFSREVLGA